MNLNGTGCCQYLSGVFILFLKSNRDDWSGDDAKARQKIMGFSPLQVSDFRSALQSANALAEKVGVTQSSMSNIINGKVNTSLLTLEKIANVLGVEIWELFTERTTVEVFPERATSDLTAIVAFKGKSYVASSIDELEKIVFQLREFD